MQVQQKAFKWRENVSICLVNLIGPALRHSQIFAFTPVSFKRASATAPAKFKWSIWSTVLWLTIACAYVACVILKCIYWPAASDMESAIRILFTIEFINQTSAFMIAISYYTQAKTRAAALNDLSILVYDPPKGLKYAMTQDKKKKIQKQTIRQVRIIYTILICLCTSVFICYFLGDADKYYKNPYLYFMDQLISCFNITIFVFNAFDCSLFASIIIAVLQSVLESTITVFGETSRRTQSSVGHQHASDLQFDNLDDATREQLIKGGTVRICDRIADIRNAYGMIVTMKEKINDCLNPQIAIATSLTLIIVVLNSYLLFIIITTGTFNTLSILSFAKVLMTLTGVVIQISVADDLYRMVSLIFGDQEAFHLTQNDFFDILKAVPDLTMMGSKARLKFGAYFGSKIRRT